MNPKISKCTGTCGYYMRGLTEFAELSGTYCTGPHRLFFLETTTTRNLKKQRRVTSKPVAIYSVQISTIETSTRELVRLRTQGCSTKRQQCVLVGAQQ